MLSTETALDLRYNIAAFTIAICSEEFMLPEKAFSIISESCYMHTDEDVKDMLEMVNQGMTYRQIAEIYNSTASNIFHRVKRYKSKEEKELSDRHLKSSVN